MRLHLLKSVITIISVGYLYGCASQAGYNRRMVYSSPETQMRIEELQQKLYASPDDNDVRLELGGLLLKEGYPTQAKVEFQYVIKTDSKNVPAYLLLSSALQRQRNPDLEQAAKNLETARNVMPEHPDVHLNLAQIYHEMGQEENSINEFRKVIELSDDPTTLVPAHLGLMSIYQKKSEVDKANIELKEARKLFPEVDDVIKNAEINQVTPSPTYAGHGHRSSDGIHPALEKRIELIQKEIKKRMEKKK